MGQSVNIRKTSIQGVVVVETSTHTDERGNFARLFCARVLNSILDGRQIVQINHSRTAEAGAIRGMHFQRPPNAEMKLVRCIRGKIWDVSVDLRRDSRTFLKSHAEELTPENARMVIVPEGCAHGFQALESDSELLYLHTEFYTPDAEDGVRHDDPKLAIAWPLPVTNTSLRDSAHSHIDPEFRGLNV